MKKLFATMVAALTIGAGCTEEPQVPQGGAGPVGSGDLLGTPQPGQVWTMPDTGSGEGIGANRPKMSDAALAFYQQGMQAFVGGDLPNAKRLFQSATEADSKAFQAYYSLGVVQERLRDDGALSSYRQAYTIIKDYEPAIVAWAMLKARKGSTSEADSFLTQKRNELPKSAAVVAALAEVKSLAKDSGSAQSLAAEALKINPDFKPAMITIARDYYRARKLDLALLSLKAILEGFDEENKARDPENAEALLLRGLIFKEQGDRLGAIDTFQKALAKRPDLVEARVQLATFLLQSGGVEQARPLVEGALRFDAESLPAHLLLGDCYRLEGKYPEAKQRFDYVLGKDASLYHAHYNLGLLYLNAPSMPSMSPMQQVDAATASLKKYQDLRPKGSVDDSDELLQRAKLKRGELEAAQQAAAPTPPPPAPPPATPPKP
ncbi:MAG: tetratricopeptide repeat protein [Polyangiaceae bacterium]|jgi:tetratricopeptide (TPR) repeat protein|nr:tetratricopeptide repeat protein [Polyangiaceae bacterium]MBK8938936.1 tetratricopeptide repeat protein [Polyangiaceae bacterium]